MADYLSRHSSPCIKTNQLKAEDLWNDWFTISKIDSKKFVLDEQNRRRTGNQPIRGRVTSESKTAKEKERQANENQPIKTRIENEKQVVRKSERTDSAEKEVLCKQEKQTIKDIIASISVQESMSS